MTTTTNPTSSARAFALPNLLTYARIAAVPVVVACMYWQAILEYGLWLRWAALFIFIAAGLTDILMDMWRAPTASSRASAACSTRSPTSCSSHRAC